MAKQKAKTQKAATAAEQAPRKPVKVGADFEGMHQLIIASVGGQRILDGAKKVREGANSISQRLLAIAKTFPNLAAFKAETDRQEKWLKSDEGIAEVNRTLPDANWHGGKMPDCWKQAKSNIRRTWEQEDAIAKAVPGFTLKGCKTESEMRKALNQYRNVKAGKPYDKVLTSLENCLRDFYRLGTEGDSEARKQLTAAIDTLTETADSYRKVLDRLIPEKPTAPEKAKEKAA